jgi:hypothetical protein
MDWLRSEDLKEVKVATAPIGSIAVRRKVAWSKLTCIRLELVESWVYGQKKKPRQPPVRLQPGGWREFTASVEQEDRLAEYR